MTLYEAKDLKMAAASGAFQVVATDGDVDARVTFVATLDKALEAVQSIEAAERTGSMSKDDARSALSATLAKVDAVADTGPQSAKDVSNRIKSVMASMSPPAPSKQHRAATNDPIAQLARGEINAETARKKGVNIGGHMT